MREALRCAFCRDQVARGDVVACARRACGALYHRACWEECRADYGACAVMGCGSTRAREVSLLGWGVRLLRLLVAALLFPPRLVRAVRAQQGEALGGTLRRAWSIAVRVLPSFDERRNGPLKLVMYMLTTGPVCVGFILGLRWLGLLEQGHPAWALLVFGAMLASAIFAPVPLALLLVLAFLLVRALAAALAGEVSALVRAEEPGGLVARLARGAGKK